MNKKLSLIILAVVGVFGFVLFFGFNLSNIFPDNKLQAYTLVISFVGLFGTVIGAYLGAKIAGDNARELYEHQKNQKNYEKRSKVELLTSIKLIEVLNHSIRIENDIELLYVGENDKRDIKEIIEKSVINIDDLIDGYAKPIIELLEDKELYNGTIGLYKSLLKMFNDCNRMQQHIKVINMYDKDNGHPEDYYILKEHERKMIQELYNDYVSHVRKDILSTFIEYKFMKIILDQCIQNVLKNIDNENKLFEDLKFYKFLSLPYTIKLKGDSK
ncbi:hypothetical protein [Mammaliicoccus stepanovicii]|uniref:Phage abortive infection protein n=1 Tax=Mammaliicoccus stepanovicii TaxID=643214 RepID=A0A239ZWK1_9STAP|nr:hypothetical protein [Mammaliicoccus stepanovicii]PNZ75398.1 hypothetical protein CD111_07725 [Mammaliicoccus stepanovicii]GGI39119.1 hypothetical protein GCM10010896_01790 [Mammaliicoccus stepanovicii]SNV75359.1 Uncharacterised protein [Mammaliicoccus stepanovicii]